MRDYKTLYVWEKSNLLTKQVPCYLIYDIGFIPKELYDVINKAVNELKAMLIAFIKFLGDGNNHLPFAFNLLPKKK